MEELLIAKLGQITEEEKNLLAGGKVERERYTSGGEFTIDSRKLLKKGKLITIRPHTRFTDFPRHSHNYVEMMYMCSGRTVHEINDGTSLSLEKGELLLLNQGTFHAVRRAGREDIGVNFIVLPQFFDLALAMIGPNNVLGRFLLESLGEKEKELSYLHFKVANVLPVQNLLQNLAWSAIFPQPNARKIDQTTMGLLFLQLLNYTENLELAPCAKNAVVLEVLKEIEENYPAADLTQFARERGLSLSYLSSLIHESTGKTFKELLKEKRLSKAAELLLSTRLSTQDIMVRVGYENSSYFHRIFREAFGSTPKAYRYSPKK